MKPRITVLTLGVDDLERAIAFYRDGLGFASDGIIGQEFEYGAVAFCKLESGLTLALWPRKSIAHDTGLKLENRSATEMTLGHNVTSKQEVDTTLSVAVSAGATIIKPAADTFWGRICWILPRPGRSCVGSCLQSRYDARIMLQG